MISESKERIMVTVPRKLLNQIDIERGRRGLTRSAVIADALTDWLDKKARQGGWQ
ncbi:MAG: type II toxin-antitoxin system HicB family antitoxin [Clostridia bacterium]|nr:type II toxin-antitoxin system HicB family antitoxin [Clostridia bacterium]